ncbi:MAG: hypothetical protein ACYCPS_05365 [Candidatus Saccharimonadales bacterium]
MAATIPVDPYVLQLAQMASVICGLDTNVILAQWQAEQGVASVSDWPGNNPAGMTAGTSQADALANGTSGGFLTFPTPAAGATAYADFYKYGSAYVDVRTAIPQGPVAQLLAIIASPWDGGHYHAGTSLIGAYNGITGQSISTTLGLTVLPAGTSSEASPSLPNVPAGTTPNIAVPNDVVDPHSTTYGDVLYGRRWRVTVQTALGLVLDVSDLRVAFDVKYVVNQTPPFSVVTVYNLNPATEDIVLEYGDLVTVEAGYIGTQYGLIFSGTLVEPVRGQQDATTYTLTMSCLQADRAANQAFAAFSLNRGQSARSTVTALATRASIPTPLGEISPSLSPTPLPRGQAFFGLTRDILREIAQGENLALHYTNGMLNLLGASDTGTQQIVDLTPTSGLISIPSQNGLGVQFSSLLNPALRIGTLIHIDNSLINAETFGIGQIPRALDAAGIYRIASVEHMGDTRGQQWQTNCVAYGQSGPLPSGMDVPTDTFYG